jgi:hypothetical protein
MNPRVVRIDAARDGQLDLLFANGERRRFDVRPYIARGGVFAALADPGLFAGARVVAGAIEWPGEVDLSYDTVYLRGIPISEPRAQLDGH